MSKIHVLPVQYGDALIVECQRGDEKGVIVVDGGPQSSSYTFINAISQQPLIDLMVLTHYDEDHIGGILALVDDCLD